MLKGKKTIITGIVMIVFGIGGYMLDQLDVAQAAEFMLGGAGIIFLRLGINNSDA